MKFDLPKYNSNTIKVVGVGGGGGNAVNYMYSLGIKDVDFAVCNTDAQALEQSLIPNKIQLGPKITEGLGVGGDPKMGEKSAQESINEIEELFSTNTKILFITAGMGGGTGTGAAPIIAQEAKKKGILTIGIVTIPFNFEGSIRKKIAHDGIENLRKNVDTLLIIDNNNILKIYGDLGFLKASKKADEILAFAAKGIAEIITKPLYINIDLNDVRKVLKDSGRAIFGIGKASGENRAIQAIEQAINSPLLEDNKIVNSSDILLSVISSEENGCTPKEFEIITDYIKKETKNQDLNIFLGAGEDNSILDDEISITIIATNSNRKINTFEKDQDIKNLDIKPVFKEKKPEMIIDFIFDDQQDLEVYPKNELILSETLVQLGNEENENTFHLDPKITKNSDKCTVWELNTDNDYIKKTTVLKSEINSFLKHKNDNI